MPTVFFLGATGYVGGAVLVDLVEAYPELEITALVRNPAHVDAFKGIRVKVLEGSFKDTDLISKHARAADITVNTADSDDVALTAAILAGQKARITEDGKPPAALVHTSGVAVFADGIPDGRHDPNVKVWSDANEDDIRSINDKMLHGGIDATILRASEKGDTVSYIVCPGGVVGPSTGPVSTVSLFYRFIAEATLEAQKAFYVGEGSNVFTMVRLDDLVSLYRILFKRILSGEDARASPYTRYYIAAKSTFVWKELATTVGVTLKNIGKLKEAKPQSISESALDSPALKVFIAQSQNVQPKRAIALGWAPHDVVQEDWTDAGIKTAVEWIKK